MQGDRVLQRPAALWHCLLRSRAAIGVYVLRTMPCTQPACLATDSQHDSQALSALPSSQHGVSADELRVALLATVPEPQPAPLGQLLRALQEGQLTLQTFCRALRCTLGPKVLMAAVARVAQNKASRTHTLWHRGLAFARLGVVWLGLHASMKRKAEACLPPIKRRFVRQLVTSVLASDHATTESHHTARRPDDSSSPLVFSVGITRHRRTWSGDALTPPRTKRGAFDISATRNAGLSIDNKRPDKALVTPKEPPKVTCTNGSMDALAWAMTAMTEDNRRARMQAATEKAPIA